MFLRVMFSFLMTMDSSGPNKSHLTQVGVQVLVAILCGIGLEQTLKKTMLTCFWEDQNGHNLAQVLTRRKPGMVMGTTRWPVRQTRDFRHGSGTDDGVV